jgi:hypothetical protein
MAGFSLPKTMTEFLIASQHPDDQPFHRFVKLPASFSSVPPHIGVQVNQTNNNTGDVTSAISEKEGCDADSQVV